MKKHNTVLLLILSILFISCASDTPVAVFGKDINGNPYAKDFKGNMNVWEYNDFRSQWKAGNIRTWHLEEYYRLRESGKTHEQASKILLDLEDAERKIRKAELARFHVNANEIDYVWVKIRNPTPWPGKIRSGIFQGLIIKPGGISPYERPLPINKEYSFYIENLHTGRVIVISRTITANTTEIVLKKKNY